MPVRKSKSITELREEYIAASPDARLPAVVVAAGLGLSVLTLERWRQLGRGPEYHRRARRITYIKRKCEAWMQADEEATV